MNDYRFTSRDRSLLQLFMMRKNLNTINLVSKIMNELVDHARELTYCFSVEVAAVIEITFLRASKSLLPTRRAVYLSPFRMDCTT